MKRAIGLGVCMLVGTLTGCHWGKSSDQTPAPPATYTLGGSISGLTAAGLTLTNGGQSVSPASGDSSFTFPTSLASGTTYDVQVSASPTGLNCSVAQGSGTMPAANVSSVSVSCTPATFSLGGTITGLASTGLVLANGGDTVAPASGATQFTFTQAIAFGAAYQVTVQAQPASGTCSVTNGSGTMPAAAVNTVAVTCTAPPSLTVLHDFLGNPTDGSQPAGGVTLANDGNFYGLTYSAGNEGAGVVYSLTPSGIYTIIHSFTAGTGDSGSPLSALIVGQDGNLYGTGQSGGTHNQGSVFKISTGGALTLLHSFAAAPSDGSDPQGALVQGADGSLYGTTYTGGSQNAGTVYRIASDGTYSLLHSFTGPDGSSPKGGLVLASDGNLYGTTWGGGAHNSGTVFMITVSGTESVLYSFAGQPNDGADPAGELLQASDGALYGSTYDGGAANLGTVFRITLAGSESMLHSFSGPDGSYPQQGTLIEGSDGLLYGTTFGNGTSQLGTVYRMSLGGTITLLYSFAGPPGDGSDAIGGLVRTSDGSLYGVTYQGGTVNDGTVFKLIAP